MMNEQRMRTIFAEELEINGEMGLARAIRSGYDNSNAGTAAIAAMKRIADFVAAEAREGT